MPQIKSCVRKALAIAVLLISLTKKRYVTKSRAEYSKNRLKECTLCSQRFLHIRKARPYKVARQAFSEIVLPTGNIDQNEDEVQSYHRILPVGRRIIAEKPRQVQFDWS